jgi:hypothetical protein
MFGVLFPFIIAIPSVIRYWNYQRKIKNHSGEGRLELPPYDDVWFEGQATRLGEQFKNMD